MLGWPVWGSRVIILHLLWAWRSPSDDAFLQVFSIVVGQAGEKKHTCRTTPICAHLAYVVGPCLSQAHLPQGFTDTSSTAAGGAPASAASSLALPLPLPLLWLLCTCRLRQVSSCQGARLEPPRMMLGLGVRRAADKGCADYKMTPPRLLD